MALKRITDYTLATTPLAGTEQLELDVAGLPFRTTSLDIAKTAVQDAINDGTLDRPPSQNAVFDALALKAPLASPTFTGVPAADTAAAGTNTTQLATTAFVKTATDAAVAGLSWKQSVRAATTVDGTLATAYANASIIDGVTLATGDRILIKNQTAGAENGIYTVNASGAPTRSTDADSGAELVNASVYVSEGTTLADTQWTCSTNAPITVGTTALVFAQLTSGGGQPLDATLTAFAALTIAADSLSIGTGADAFSQTTFAANTFPAKASTGALVAKVISDDALAFNAAANNAAMRTALGLGTLATQSGTFSGTSSGTNTGDQTNISGNAATVTTNANLTGDVTSVGNAATIAALSVTTAKLADAAVTQAQVKIKTAVALADAAATLTAAQMIDSGLFTITPTVARILTTDTAANIVAGLSRYQVGTWFDFTVVNTAAFDVTLAAGVGVTLSGKMIVSDASATFKARIDSATAVTIYNTALSKAAAGGSSAPFDDATAIIKGSVDATKLLRIEVDGLTTATTRVMTVPDADFTAAGINIAQTFTLAQTFSAGAVMAAGQALILDNTSAPSTPTKIVSSNTGYNLDFYNRYSASAQMVLTGSALKLTGASAGLYLGGTFAARFAMSATNTITLNGDAVTTPTWISALYGGAYTTNGRHATDLIMALGVGGNPPSGVTTGGNAGIFKVYLREGGTGFGGAANGSDGKFSVYSGSTPTEVFSVSLNGDLSLTKKLISATAPTIASGFGTSPSISASNGTAAFTLTIGTATTGISTGTLTMPAATTGWVVNCQNVTNPASFVVAQTGGSTTTVTLTNYSRTTGLAIDFTASDVIRITAMAY